MEDTSDFSTAPPSSTPSNSRTDQDIDLSQKISILETELTSYQQALNISEIQKQQLIDENTLLKMKLHELGTNSDDILIADTHNGSGSGVVPNASTTNVPIIANDDNQHEQRVEEGNLNDISTNNDNTDNLVVTNAVAAALGDHTSTSLDISTAEAEALAAVDAHHLQAHDTTVTTNTNTTSATTNLSSSRSDEKWDSHYRRLIEYKNLNGNCLVPTSTELGRWLCRQRHNHRYKGLKEDRKVRLLELDPTCFGEKIESNGENQIIMDDGDGGEKGGGGGCHDDITSSSANVTSQSRSVPMMKTKYNLAYESKLHEKWNFFFQQLIDYKKQHGHCNFPTMNGSLGRWISRQRTLYRSQKLKSDRYEKLKSIDFTFEDAMPLEFKNKLDTQWENMYNQLLEHKEKEGHCFDVPEEMPLGKWLYRQRWLYRHGNLREDRAKKLLNIGFEDKKVSKKPVDDSGVSGTKRKRKRISNDPGKSDDSAGAIGGGADFVATDTDLAAANTDGGGRDQGESTMISNENETGQSSGDCDISFDHIMADGTDDVGDNSGKEMNM